MSEPGWFVHAKEYQNTAEYKGPRHNPEVVDFFSRAHVQGVHDDETAWCAAFACAMLEDTGVRSPRSAWARDFMNWGEPLEVPEIGCIVVFRRGTGGHVGFFAGYSSDGSQILVYGGNQSDKVCYQYYPTKNLLGFRWPSASDYMFPLHPPAPPVNEEELPKPVRPVPVHGPLETRRDVEDRLRENGSRTVRNADSAEVKSKVQTTFSIGALLTTIMTYFSDLYQQLSPLTILAGAGSLAMLSLIFAVYMTYNARSIRNARVDDDIHGLHLGRKDVYEVSTEYSSQAVGAYNAYDPKG